MNEREVQLKLVLEVLRDRIKDALKIVGQLEEIQGIVKEALELFSEERKTDMNDSQAQQIIQQLTRIADALWEMVNEEEEDSSLDDDSEPPTMEQFKAVGNSNPLPAYDPKEYE